MKVDLKKEECWSSVRRKKEMRRGGAGEIGGVEGEEETKIMQRQRREGQSCRGGKFYECSEGWRPEFQGRMLRRGKEEQALRVWHCTTLQRLCWLTATARLCALAGWVTGWSAGSLDAAASPQLCPCLHLPPCFCLSALHQVSLDEREYLRFNFFFPLFSKIAVSDAAFHAMW